MNDDLIAMTKAGNDDTCAAGVSPAICGAGVSPAENESRAMPGEIFIGRRSAEKPLKRQEEAGGTPAPQEEAGETPAAQFEFHFVDPRETPFSDPQTRGYLPHLYKEGGSYFVTFRLWDAVVPKEEQKKAGGTPAAEGAAGGTPAAQERRKTREEIAAESEPPLQRGSCVLANPAIAEVVQNALKHFHGERYYLHAWCVMPNHVHVVYTALPGHTPEDIHHSWNSYTAHKANKILKRSGRFWEPEGFDHLIRSLDDLEWFISYTEENPVAAGFCRTKEQWRWSSAGSGWNPGCGAGVPPAFAVGRRQEMSVSPSVGDDGEDEEKAGGTPAAQRSAGGTPAAQVKSARSSEG